MSRKKEYPKLGEISELKCCRYPCKEKATHKIRIKQSEMRGEDDVCIVCPQHLKIAEERNWELF